MRTDCTLCWKILPWRWSRKGRNMYPSWRFYATVVFRRNNNILFCRFRYLLGIFWTDQQLQAYEKWFWYKELNERIFNFSKRWTGWIAWRSNRNSGDFNRTDRMITWWARAVCSELHTAYSIPLILGISPSRGDQRLSLYSVISPETHATLCITRTEKIPFALVSEYCQC